MSSIALSGRAASMARRKALAQGKTALPPPRERSRTGFREAALPAEAIAAAPVGAPAPAVASAPPPPAPAPSQAAPPPGGRALLKWRRQQLARGKAGLPPSPPQRQAGRSAAEPAREVTPPAATAAAAAAPRGELAYPAKAFASPTQRGLRVTGVRIGPGTQVTGADAGAAIPVSGTQYAAQNQAERGAPPKIGWMRTDGGRIVSGTLVRSRVRITGDEAGEGKPITGEVDGRAEDDLTERGERSFGAQFPRRAEPHGASVFGVHLGRAGARSRERTARPIEVTASGLPVTGTAVGRSARVTGDEDGACREITGDQYATPASHASACGGTGGGTAAPEHLGAARPDPVTGAKVVARFTWRGLRVTGPDVEHRPPVTGDEPGSCAPVTGTPYQGPATAESWCAPEQAQQMRARQMREAGTPAISGDVPRNAGGVTGTERGAERGVTGTPYYGAERGTDGDADALARIDRAFTVRSPQRQAQLEARGATAAAEPRITGSFAVGQGKVTGNVEFLHRTRLAADDAKRPRITGEGRTEGPAITGDAWRSNPRVTGTEGFVAVERNPSERAGKPHAFASARLFKDKGHHQEPRQIVTGMVGWTPKSAAKVTLSGGAQG
jgi:hypothetical protein